MKRRRLMFISGMVLSSCVGTDRVVRVGERIHHDDFEYSVQHVERADRIADRPARGRFVIVTFQVENRARVVDHRWGNDVAFLIDQEGRTYENDRSAQEALERVAPFGDKAWHITPAGAVDATRMVFDVPADATEIYLQVRGLTLMGDVFDLNQFRRTRVKLF